VAFGGRNAKGRTTCPLFSEYPASVSLSREFTFTLQIAQPIEVIGVKVVTTQHDINALTGKEVFFFTLARSPVL